MNLIKTLTVITVVLFVLMAGPCPAISGPTDTQLSHPSFDCLKAMTKIEETICGDQKLSRLDVELALIYKELLTDLPEADKGTLKREQRAWLKIRDTACDASTKLNDCISNVYVQRIDSLKKEVAQNHIQRMTFYQKKYDFGKLTFKEIVADDNILKDIYSYRNKDDVTIDGKTISLSLYTVKYDELVFNDFIPKSIIIVKSAGKETRLPIAAYRPLEEIDYSIPKTKSPVLLIGNPSGGNAANANPYYVISLENRYFLHNLGLVSGYQTIDHDTDVLIVYDDIWENGLGLLDHADSPCPIIIFTAEQGKLSRDISRYAGYYQAEFRKLNAEIDKYPRYLPPEMNSRLLAAILQKFLIFRIMGEDSKAWKEFNTDIRHYDNDNFYLNNGVSRVGGEKIPIAEIVRRMEDSLKKRRSQ